MEECKKTIVIVGDGYVGKTSILNALKEHCFEEQIPNVYDDFEWKENINGKTYIFKFMDTAGQEEYELIRKLCCKEADLFLMCFAVDDKVSFENMVTHWVPGLLRENNIPIALVGTKSDLRADSKSCIHKENIISFQKKMHAAFYVECSAKTQEGIDELKKKIIKYYSKERSCVLQ